MRHLYGRVLRAAGLVAPAFVAACGGGVAGDSRESVAKSEGALRVSPAVVDGAGTLGDGYHTDTQSLGGECVTGSVDLVDPGTGTLGFMRQMNASDLSTELGIGVGGKATFGPFTVNAAAKFSLNVQSNNYTDTYVFTSGVSDRVYRLSNMAATQRALNLRASQGKQAALDMCGTEFIQSARVGAKLYTAVRFDFASDEVKSKFDAEIQIDYLSLFKVNGQVSTAYHRYGKQVSVSIFAYQLGGDPSQLGQIIGGGAQDQNSGASAALSCSLEKLDDCERALQNMANYVSGSFVNQIDVAKIKSQDPNAKFPFNYGIMVYDTMPYKNAGLGSLIEDDSPFVAAAVTYARKRIFDRYNALRNDEIRANQLSPSPTMQGDFRLTATQKAAVEDAKAKIELQVPEVETVGIACYTDMSQCPGKVSALLLKLDTDPRYKYDPGVLVKALGYYEYCMQGRNDDSIVSTMKVIDNTLHFGSMSCDEKADEIENLDTLQLDKTDESQDPISDLRPLRGFFGLKSLSLRNQQATNIGPLLSLPGLQKLDLRSNGLVTVGRFALLKNLTYLDVAYNQIKDLGPLSSLTNLQTLKAQGNPITDPSTFTPPASLTTKIINDNDLCHVERKWLLDHGQINQDDYDSYEQVNWAPVYQTPGNPSSGITDWVYCSAVSHALLSNQ